MYPVVSCQNEERIVLRHIIFLFCVLILSISVSAQPKWKRSKSPKKVPLALFHSTMTANFPTAEMLKKGDFQYEISHRFVPPIKDGFDALWGLNGPAKIRTSLSYAISNRVMLTFGHVNLLNNLDFHIKYRLLEIDSKTLPSAVAIRAGIAVNPGIPNSLDRGDFDSDNFQYFAQLVYNTMFFNKKFGVGIVPSYLYNSSIFTIDKQYTFTIGNYYQYYFNHMWSVWLELNPIVAGYQGFIAPDEIGNKSFNHVALGFDIETGGHFFHLFVTNNSRISPTQFLVGADKKAGSDSWRVAFGITREL